jgi:hypothetical protein
VPKSKFRTLHKEATLSDVIMFLNNQVREMNYLLSHLDGENLDRLDNLLMKPVTLTATTPTGNDGEVRWGISSLGAGPHVWKSGGWNYLNTTPVP